MPQTPTRRVHAVLGKLPADQNDGEKEATANTPNFYTELIFWQRLNQNLPERKITKSDNRPQTKTEATKQSQSKPRQTETQIRNDVNPDRPEIQTAEGRTEVCKTRGLCRTKHLRRMKGWLQKLKIVCAAVADERESR